jgi:hypothetical protein
MVFLSQEAAEPAVARLPAAPLAIFDRQVALAGYDAGRSAEVRPDVGWGQIVTQAGQALPLTLYWEAIGRVHGDYTVFLHLLGPDGRRVAQDDGPALSGLQPMPHWLEGELLADRRSLELPGNLQPGQYRLVAGLYGPDDGDRLPIMDAAGNSLGETLTLDYVRIPGPGAAVPSPERLVEAELGGKGSRVRLLGYELAKEHVSPGDELHLTLYWQALTPVVKDYTVFVHLLDEAGQIKGQGDGPPVDGFQPTTFWDPGEVIVDGHVVTVDADAPPGTYRLAVGLYQPSSGQRLAGSEGDRVLLGEVQVGP